MRPGYKMTEVGVIPEGWGVRILGTLATLKSGYAFQSDTYTPLGDFRVITIANVQDGWMELGECNKVASIPMSLQAHQRLVQGDILISMTGNVGRVCRVNDDYCLLNQRVGKLIPREVLADFLFFLLGQRQFILAMAKKAKGGAQCNLSNTDITEHPFAVPPAGQEQQAIATALADVDALLDALTCLIAKKRDLRQAAMQQLLSGKWRLPGFSGEWKSRTLEDVAAIRAGINKPLSEMGCGALYVTVQDLYHGSSIPIELLGRIRLTTAEVQAKALVPGDIVFGKSSVKRDGIGYPNQFLGASEPAVWSGFTYMARAYPDITDPRFLFYALRWDPTRRWLIDNSQASALTNINQAIANAIPIYCPPLPEQQAIATILTDMDAELTALESRLAKTRALKQGMMQQLLTGRIRLV